MMQTTSVGRGSESMPQRRMLLLAAVVCAGVALVATLWLTRRGQAPSAPPMGQEPAVKKIPVVGSGTGGEENSCGRGSKGFGERSAAQ